MNYRLCISWKVNWLQSLHVLVSCILSKVDTQLVPMTYVHLVSRALR